MQSRAPGRLAARPPFRSAPSNLVESQKLGTSGDVGVVGGAVGTAGAIATAPFRGNAYAYNDRSDRRYSNSSDRGYQSGDKRTYAQRNGFVCEPGKRFKGEDGKQHMCQ
jgi:hypothetical protein